MNLAAFWIKNRVVTLVLTFFTIGAGLVSFGGMSRLEDPEFTIKDALVVTPYVGASAREVEEEVSDTEASPDAAADAGAGAGASTDAGADTGTDAGTDAGTDTETD